MNKQSPFTTRGSKKVSFYKLEVWLGWEREQFLFGNLPSVPPFPYYLDEKTHFLLGLSFPPPVSHIHGKGQHHRVFPWCCVWGILVWRHQGLWVPTVLSLYPSVSDLKSSDGTFNQSSREASRPVPRHCDMGHVPFRGSSLSALCITSMISYTSSLPGLWDMDLPKPPGMDSKEPTLESRSGVQLCSHTAQRDKLSQDRWFWCASGVSMGLVPKNKMPWEVSSWTVSCLMDIFYYLDSRPSRPVVSYFSNAVTI